MFLIPTSFFVHHVGGWDEMLRSCLVDYNHPSLHTLDITKIEPMDLFISLQKSSERCFTRWDPILRESTLFAMDDMFHLGVTVDGWTATGETDRHWSCSFRILISWLHQSSNIKGGKMKPMWKYWTAAWGSKSKWTRLRPQVKMPKLKTERNILTASNNK